MTHTDLILISKDKYLHLGLGKNRNPLSDILMNELVPVEEAHLESKQCSAGYHDEYLARQGMLKPSANSVYEEEKPDPLKKQKEIEAGINNYMEFSKEYGVNLTRTENEIMLFILNGAGIPEMASELGCSKKVIYTHKYNIIKKYGFRTFNELHAHILQYDQN